MSDRSQLIELMKHIPQRVTSAHERAGKMNELAQDHLLDLAHLATLTTGLKKLTEQIENGAPWDRDITDELATNPGPYSNKSLQSSSGWWKRDLDQIDGVTIHHTLSDSPHATAKHYVNKSGGRPSIPYTIWVTQTGEILLCVDLQEGLWHDHTGHKNMHLSIGLAGQLHLYSPSGAQLQAAVGVCAWAITTLPAVISISQIKGHRDWVKVYHDRGYYPPDRTPWTTCPGWASARSGQWKSRFYKALRRVIDAA